MWYPSSIQIRTHTLEAISVGTELTRTIPAWLWRSTSMALSGGASRSFISLALNFVSIHLVSNFSLSMSYKKRGAQFQTESCSAAGSYVLFSTASYHPGIALSLAPMHTALSMYSRPSHSRSFPEAVLVSGQRTRIQCSGTSRKDGL